MALGFCLAVLIAMLSDSNSISVSREYIFLFIAAVMMITGFKAVEHIEAKESK